MLARAAAGSKSLYKKMTAPILGPAPFFRLSTVPGSKVSPELYPDRRVRMKQSCHLKWLHYLNCAELQFPD